MNRPLPERIARGRAAIAEASRAGRNVQEWRHHLVGLLHEAQHPALCDDPLPEWPCRVCGDTLWQMVPADRDGDRWAWVCLRCLPELDAFPPEDSARWLHAGGTS
jgi:hypothetical protein